jgi:hypothetical protein
LENTVRRVAVVLAVPALALSLLTVGATTASADDTGTAKVTQLMHPPKCC